MRQFLWFQVKPLQMLMPYCLIAITNTSADAGKNSPARKECRNSMDALHVEATTSFVDYSQSFAKVSQEVESLETGIDNLDGFPFKTYTTRTLGKFQPMVNPRIRKEIPAPFSSCLAPCTNEEAATEASLDPGTSQSVQSFDAVVGTCPVLETGTQPLVSNYHYGLQQNSAIQSSCSSSALMEFDVDNQNPGSCSIHNNDGMLETKIQESRAISNLHPTYLFSESAVASENMCYVNSTPVFPSDDDLDYSSISFGNFTTSEMPTHEKHANIASTSCPQDTNLEDACEDPENESRGRKASSATNQINKGDASSRQLRKRTVASRLIDEPDDEVSDLNVELPSISALDVEDKDYECRENEEDNDKDNSGRSYSSQRDKMSKRSKKHPPKKEKPVKKIKGSDDAADLPSRKAPRKFSHSTRRKKRLQELLALPEHEIEFQRLPCRDVILLAEHREQLASKETKAAKTSQNNQSTLKALKNYHSNNDNEDDVEENSRMESTFTLFNSHSFMDKTPRIKWSKLDTELFYEGVRQFGIDLSMIQQLFPGRTRNQMKFKLRKEERQQPTRFYEALSNRSKDHSYFEKVIEQLQKVAAQGEEELDKDELAGGSGMEETDLYSENNFQDVGGKSENENDAAGDDEVNTGEVHSPVKSDEDLDIWSSYRC